MYGSCFSPEQFRQVTTFSQLLICIFDPSDSKEQELGKVLLTASVVRRERERVKPVKNKL